MYSDPTGTVGIFTMIVAALVSIFVAIFAENAHYADNLAKNTHMYDVESAKQAILSELIKVDDSFVYGDIKIDEKTGNLSIKGSYKVKDSRVRLKIANIYTNTLDSNGKPLTNRTVMDLSAEWFGHNVVSKIYSIFTGKRLSRTDDVDLNRDIFENEWYVTIGTYLLTILGWC